MVESSDRGDVVTRCNWGDKTLSELIESGNAGAYHRILEQWLGINVCYSSTRVLEIGVYQGAGLLALCSILGVSNQYVGVDISLSELRVDPSKFDCDVILVQGSSQTSGIIERVHSHGPYDLIFIDGEHTYEGCKADYENYLPCLSPDGVLFMHDVDGNGEHTEVHRFWNELVYQPNDRFHFVTYHSTPPLAGNYSLGICLPHGTELF